MKLILKRIYFYTIVALFGWCLSACSPSTNVPNSDWCDQPLRSELSELNEIKTSRPWFKVYQVGEGVFAILEPYNFQEVISYLILGSEKALLFDTGMGLDSISLLVSELTSLPVTVFNSHTHYDHMGGNHEFEHILAMNTEYTRHYATNGWSHDQVHHEVASDAVCAKMLPNAAVSDYYIQPFSIDEFVSDGHVIDLGDRTLEVLSIPGHTPDATALLDREAGYLWTGDTYYPATIWLFFEGTDLDAYENSINRLAGLTPSLQKVFPAHNLPFAEPTHLIELKEAFESIRSGDKKAKPQDYSGHPEDDEAALFEFEHFSFLIRKDLIIKSTKSSFHPNK